MRLNRVLGVDPGAAHTGLAVLEAPQSYLFSETLHKPSDEDVYGWAAWCALNIRELVDRWAPSLVAIEGVRPMGGFAAQKDMIQLSLVAGYLIRDLAYLDPPRLIVEPQGFGSQPLGTYPDELVGPLQRKKPGWESNPSKSGKFRHERSAWDIAKEALSISS